MKIKTIMCNANEGFYKAHAPARKAMEKEGLELQISRLNSGPQSLESAVDVVQAGLGILEQVETAKDEACDAVVLDCAADPILQAAKEVSPLPLLGAGESSYLLAMLLCERFSVITVLPCTSTLVKQNIQKYGFMQRLASVRSVNIPVLSLEDEKIVEEGLYKVACEAIEKDGAQAIVLGCTGMMEVQKRLQDRLGVPVIEPYTASIKLAEVLVEMGLNQSKLAYQAKDEK